MNPTTISYFRNFIFGVEDSLVSTVGLLSGVAIAGMSREAIFVTGVILIFVEAISMAAGSFLSEASAESLEHRNDALSRESYMDGIVMFISYFCAGFIPLAPYVLFDVSVAFWSSIAASIGALFVLGVVSGKLSRTSIMRSGTRMLIVGGLAIAIGVIVGQVLKL